MEQEVRRFVMGPAQEGQTVKAYLRGTLHLSAHQISRLKFRERGICLEGQQVSVTAVLHAGQVLELSLTGADRRVGSAAPRQGEPTLWQRPPKDLPPLSVLYDSADLLIVDKPTGLVCHPSPGHFSDTLANQAAWRMGDPRAAIRFIGRLDRDTSGVVVMATTAEAAAILQREHRLGELRKTYLAVVRGTFSEREGAVDTALCTDEEHLGRMRTVRAGETGKSALTRWRVLWQGEDRDIALVRCVITHGRTHQIRVHLSSIGHPILGDVFYGGEESPAEGERQVQTEEKRGESADAHDPGRLLLHAWQVQLRLPFTGEELLVTAPVPQAFVQCCPGAFPLN